MSESATPDAGPLTVEQAIESLAPSAPPVEQEDTASEVIETPEATEPQGETTTPEDTDAEPVEPAEGEETEAEPEAVAPVEPPKYWSQEAKAKFALLDPELQAVVLSQEGPREEATAKVKAEAAQKIQAADAELAKVNQLAAALNERVPEWLEVFKDREQQFQDRWGTQPPNWLEIAAGHGDEAATRLKLQYDTEKDQLQTVKTATEQARTQALEAQRIASQATLKVEWQKLAEIAPELAPDVSDPSKGAEARQEVTKWLFDKGFPPEAIAQISADELSLAHDAKRWREAQAALKAAPKPKPAALAPRTPVRPAAAQAQSSPQRAATQVANRFAQTRSIDDAVALLLAKKA